MKIENLLVQHLYSSKELTLQGIGTFRMNPHVALPAPNDKDFVMPADAIQFEYNPRATEDEKLIAFIVQQTGKMKFLASSDLDSYIALSKQFLNIGKPLHIEGIGTLQKSQQEGYEFTPGHFVTAKIEDSHRQIKEKEEEAISFESAPKRNNQRNITAAVVILLLALAGLTSYYFFIKKKHHDEAVNNEQPAATVAMPDTTKKDTIIKTVDTTLSKITPAKKDSFNFKVVIKEYADSGTANRAFRRLQLTKYASRLIEYQTDSLYKIAIPFMTPLSDTTNERDSIHMFFQGDTKIEL